jgi:hypothetical protein
MNVSLYNLLSVEALLVNVLISYVLNTWLATATKPQLLHQSILSI